MNDQTDTKGIFISWHHPTSGRNAILEEMNGMVWLYLTQPDSMVLEHDCPAFTTTEPVENLDWKLIEETGDPPSITREFASPSTIIRHPRAEDFGAEWSPDGESVGIVHRGRLICMIVSGAKRGYSRAIAKDGPLGLPFDETLASKIFGPQ